MAYNTQSILTDVNSKPIPQLFNPKSDSYEPVQGSADSGFRVQLAGSIKDWFEGTTNTTKTYLDSMRGFGIINDDSVDLTFTINGITIKVKSGELFEDIFDPFTAVTITATGAFRAFVKG